MFGVMLVMILEIFTVCMVVAHAYENYKTIEQCRQEARKTRVTIRRNFEDWRGIMEKSIGSDRL
jgi:hypothetical protein